MYLMSTGYLEVLMLEIQWTRGVLSTQGVCCTQGVCGTRGARGARGIWSQRDTRGTRSDNGIRRHILLRYMDMTSPYGNGSNNKLDMIVPVECRRLGGNEAYIYELGWSIKEIVPHHMVLNILVHIENSRSLFIKLGESPRPIEKFIHVNMSSHHTSSNSRRRKS